ncbi:MAG: hypothetical protein KatS3mg060_0733 [Dehalococcoidia bacterium]|nr:MAG: hypothetical protein KatS3mg060_0733 [Dehalococcoidia bacterium]
MTFAASQAFARRTDRRLLETLINQQFWCWGQDIRRPAGNLLLAYGFARTRPPAGVLGSSCYRLTGRAYEVTLWGWGLLITTSAGGIFLPRQGFAPRLVREPLAAPCWSPDGLPPLTDDDDPALGRWFQTAAVWIADYELWVLQTAGLAYRRACVAGSPRSSFSLFPELVPALWRHAGDRVAHRGGAPPSGRERCKDTDEKAIQPSELDDQFKGRLLAEIDMIERRRNQQRARCSSRQRRG